MTSDFERFTRTELVNDRYNRAAQAHLESLIRKKMESIMGQREEVLSAFIAKYGCGPDEVIQICERDPVTFIERWYVRKKTAEEMAGT